MSTTESYHYRVGTELRLKVLAPGKIALTVAAAATAQELLTITDATGEVTATEVRFPQGSRVHVFELARGEATIRYRAEGEQGAGAAEPVSIADSILYTWPSRYCPSDRLGVVARGEFGSLPDARAKVDAIVRYVSERVLYTSGSSRSSDGAIETLLSGEGVCRDFAHLCIGFCRSLDIPARFVSVYAPGLSPMDFHAVFEVVLDGKWWLFDATHLAPRSSMVRIATGRDAADVAFLSTLGCEIEMISTSITAVAEPNLPQDDHSSLVALP